ncbi:MAG: sulfatase-like hydrolase/transferase [Planctomycetota bacterium]|jgi:arylsulfatase A
MSMNRREFLRQLGYGAAGAAALSWLPAWARGAEAGGKKPNVILIMADDLGYECIAANGCTSYKTPVLDKLAGNGVRFEHCYSQPLCTPSRVQIMTGIYNVRNYVKFGVLRRSETTFAHLLKKAGYATCVVGKWQLGREKDSPQHFGFDQSCLWQHTRRPSRYASPGVEVNGEPKDHPGKYGPDVCTDFACDFIAANKDKPFMIYYPMILTHCPFEPTPDSADWDPKSKGSKTYKGKPQYFGDMVTYMDKLVGRLVAQLDKHGLRENTLILFTGDNGTDTPINTKMGEVNVKPGKGAMTDNGTRVPLIASWPAAMPRGRVSQDLVDFSDFLPTMCEAGGAAVPAELAVDGQSFLPQLKGEPGNPRKWIYCWYSRSGGARAKVFARNQRYKLTHDGKFYDMQNGYSPKSLKPKNLTGEATEAHKMLQGVLDKYKDARPANLKGGASGGGRRKKKGKVDPG